MDNLKLLGLQRAEFAAAERSQATSSKLRVAMLVVSIFVIGLQKGWLSYVGAILNLILVILWKIFKDKGRRSHYIAERGRRAVLLSGGLDIGFTGKLYTDLLSQFTVSETDGKKYEDPEYFKAYGLPGYLRLAKMLEESAFWTKHLYDKSASRYWLLFSGGLLIAIVGLLLISNIADSSSGLLVSQIFCLLLAWLVTEDIFTGAQSFTSAARAIDDVENRLSVAVSSESLEKDLLIILGDYNAIVQNTPIIPTSIYEKNKEKLNRLWLERYSRANK